MSCSSPLLFVGMVFYIPKPLLIKHAYLYEISQKNGGKIVTRKPSRGVIEQEVTHVVINWHSIEMIDKKLCFSSNVILVQPAWIRLCITTGKLVDIEKYVLYCRWMREPSYRSWKRHKLIQYNCELHHTTPQSILCLMKQQSSI